MDPISPLPPSGTVGSTSDPAATSVGAKLVNIFVAPGEVFEELRSRPVASINWVTPLVIGVLIGIVFARVLVAQPATLRKLRNTWETANQQKVTAGKMTQQQADQIDKMLETMIGPTTMTIVIAFFSAVATVAWIFIGGLVFWAAGNFIFKADLDYFKALEAIGLASVIAALDSVIRLFLAILTENQGANLGPVLLVSSFDPLNKAHLALSTLNLMTFWHLTVISIGLSRLARVSLGKALAVVFPAWLVLALLGFIPALLSGAQH